MKQVIIASALILTGLCSYINAQDSTAWSLEKCITYAQQNNIEVKRQQLNAEYNENEYNRSKLSMIPSLEATSGYSVKYGRKLVDTKVYNEATQTDQTIQTYQNRTSQSINVGLSSNVSIFEGLSKQNAIKKQQYTLLAAQEDVKKTENNIALQITSMYMQILFDNELLNVANEQHALTSQQLDRTKKLVDAGSQAMGRYYEVKSQLAKEALNVTIQENNLIMSRLNLAHLLDLQEVRGFNVETPQIPEIEVLLVNNPDSIYTTAEGIMPQIKSSEYNLNSNQYLLKESKGYLLPSLSAGAGWGSYDEMVNGISEFDLKNNLDFNKNSYVGLSLRIPIFNGYLAKTNMKNAQVKVLDAELQLQSEKLTLRKEIQQAYADALTSYKKYVSSKDAVSSYEESFRYTEQKFNVGMVTSVEYNTSKNEYTKAQSDLLQAKYEYILRNKILDFYKGLPITL